MKNLFTIIVSMLTLLGLCTSCSASPSNSKSTTLRASDVVKRIKSNKSVVISNAHIVGLLDFTQVDNNQNIGSVMTYIDCDIVFDGCVFEDDVIAFTTLHNGNTASCIFMRNVAFRNCVFLKNINFRQAQFAFRFDAEECHFRAEADFCGISNNGASFSGTQFEGNALFISSIFNQRTSFAKVNFSQDANFQYCHFDNIVTFTDSRFGGYTDFSNAYANALCDFTNSQFGGRITMLNATFIGQLKMAKCIFFDNISITQCKIFGGLILVNAQANKFFELSDNIFGIPPDLSELRRGNEHHRELINNRTLQNIHIQ